MARVTGHIYLVPGWGEHHDPKKRGTKQRGSKWERKAGPAWYMSYRHASGTQERKLIGDAWTKRSKPRAGFYREVDAKEELDEKLAELRRGEVPDPGQRSGKTFRDAVDEFLRRCEQKALELSTLRDYRNTANGALVPEFGAHTPIEAIDQDRIDAYRDKMLTEGKLSRRSAQKHLVLLRGIFKWAKRKKWINVDPTAEVEAITVKVSGDFNVLSVPQVEQIVRHCHHAYRDGMFAAAIIVAAYTGLRTGELRALRWRDIDFAGATIHVKFNVPAGGEEKAPKSNKVRSVPLMDDAARALDGLSRREHFVGPDDRVFPGVTGGVIGEDELRDALYEAMEAAGIDRASFPARGGFVFHDLRHTFGTLAVQVWPLSDVQAYMGHANIETTMRYVHHIPKTDAAAAFSAAVEKAKAADLGTIPTAPKSADVS